MDITKNTALLALIALGTALVYSYPDIQALNTGTVAPLQVVSSVLVRTALGFVVTRFCIWLLKKGGQRS